MGLSRPRVLEEWVRSEDRAFACFFFPFLVLPKMVQCCGFIAPSTDSALLFVLHFLWASWKDDNDLGHWSIKSCDPEAFFPFLEQERAAWPGQSIRGMRLSCLAKWDSSKADTFHLGTLNSFPQESARNTVPANLPVPGGRRYLWSLLIS